MAKITGDIVINTERCKGCEVCVAACPFSVIAMAKEVNSMGPVKLSEVEGAQQNIVKTVRRLEAEGRIAISRGGGDEFI